MSREESERVLRLLETAVQVSGIPRRQLETSLGVSRGYLTQVFGGRIELKLRHIEAILAEIGLDPAAFFELAYRRPQPPRAAAGSPVEELLRSFQGLGFGALPPASPIASAGPSPAPEGLRALVREVVREVLEAERPLPAPPPVAAE